MRDTITFLKGDTKGSETDYRDALPVNMSAISRPMFGAQGYMLQQPGLTQYGTGAGIDRGGVWNERDRNHYRISGTRFIIVAEDGTVTDVAAVSGSKNASMPYSFLTQCVIADGRMWLFTKSTGNLVEVTDPDLGSPIDGVWIDQYYFMVDSENIFHTVIGDETSIDPLQFATAEFSPDPNLAVDKTTDNKAIVFGRYSIEYFANQASANFAFTRLNQRAIKSGIVGTYCKAELKGIFYIIGGAKNEDVSVHAVGVGATTKIASREVDYILNSYTESELADAVLEARTDKGYSYLIAHLPNETIIFNDTIVKKVGIEHAWSVLKSGIFGEKVWPGIHGVFEVRKGQWVYGDKASGTLGILDDTVATHYDEIAVWELTTPFIPMESDSIDQFEIETIPGFTGTKDATVSISLTYDGVYYGKQWFEMYGLPSDYGKRFIIYTLGYVASWVGIRLRGASKSRMAFARGFIDHE